MLLLLSYIIVYYHLYHLYDQLSSYILLSILSIIVIIIIFNETHLTSMKLKHGFLGWSCAYPTDWNFNLFLDEF